MTARISAALSPDAETALAMRKAIIANSTAKRRPRRRDERSFFIGGWMFDVERWTFCL
jgi:hypothetical protein